MERGEVDVRCYVAQAWLNNLSGDYVWSIPLWVQRNVMVSAHVPPLSVNVTKLATQNIGTVLNYTYPTLEPLFAKGQLKRDDARSEEQVLNKLVAGRFKYAVTNEWTLERFNQQLPPGRGCTWWRWSRSKAWVATCVTTRPCPCNGFCARCCA